MVHHADLTSQHNPVTQPTTAGDAYLTRYQTALTHHHIMSNLHKVIHLRARADYRIAEFGPVNAVARSNFNAIFNHYPPVMRYQPWLTINKIITEADRSYRCISLDYTIVADFAVALNNHIAIESAIFADSGVFADYTPCGDYASLADCDTMADIS
jgi:hypothetical protein